MTYRNAAPKLLIRSRLPTERYDAGVQTLLSDIHPPVRQRHLDYKHAKHEVLNESFEGHSERVFNYINKQHIQEKRAEVAEEREDVEEEKRSIAESEKIKPPSFFKLLLDNRSHPQNSTALRQLLYVTLLMMTLPLTALYTTRTILHHCFHVNDDSALMYGAVAAVVAVNVVTIGFGLFALYEAEDTEEEKVKVERARREQQQRDEFIQLAKQSTIAQLQDEHIQHQKRQQSDQYQRQQDMDKNK